MAFALFACLDYGTTPDGASGTAGDARGGGLVDVPGSSLPEPALPCDPAEVPREGVFVSPDGNDTSGDGSRLLPLRTITAGLTTAAAAQLENVYVAQGTYAEALSFDASRQGVNVLGGWIRTGDTWKRDCETGFRSRTLVASPTNVGVRVDGATKPTALDALTIATRATCASKPDTGGESCYGVFITGNGTVIRLSRVKVLAGAGGAGGAAITPGPGGTSTCNGLSDCSLAPRPGTPGAAASASGDQGTLAASGFVPVDGLRGQSGGRGDNGTRGNVGATMTCATPGVGQCQSGGNQCIGGALLAGNAPSGTCGCGGLGGAGGGPGRGGGASVALYVAGAGAVVGLDDCALVASKGGDGSPGSAGGEGGPPSAGVNGTPASCPQDNGPSSAPGPDCGCVGMMDKSFAGGAKGSDGARGGKGGDGSGGAGGDSIPLVILAGARVVASGEHGQRQAGAPGRGAAGSPDGRSLESFTAP